MILSATSPTVAAPAVDGVWVSPTIDILIVLAIPILIGLVCELVVLTQGRVHRRIARRRTRKRDHRDRARFASQSHLHSRG
ncbi:hypothetical protein SMNI109538_20030 [Smaragdicoccus niigatensis]